MKILKRKKDNIMTELEKKDINILSVATISLSIQLFIMHYYPTIYFSNLHLLLILSCIIAIINSLIIQNLVLVFVYTTLYFLVYELAVHFQQAYIYMNYGAIGISLFFSFLTLINLLQKSLLNNRR